MQNPPPTNTIKHTFVVVQAKIKLYSFLINTNERVICDSVCQHELLANQPTTERTSHRRGAAGERSSDTGTVQVSPTSALVGSLFLRPRSLAGRRHPGPEAVQACGAQSCSAVAKETPLSQGRSLCQASFLQGQACWRVAVTGPGQQAHEVLAVPRQAASVCRT